MRDVVLGGDLALRFGDRFRLDVASPAEAAHALCKLLDGFQAAFVGRDHQRRYRVVVGDRTLASTRECTLENAEGPTIYILPVLAGGDGLFQTIIGVALVAIGAVTGQGWLVSIGISVTIGGISQMLAPSPDAQKARDEDPNSVFDGAINASAQGATLPVLLGTGFTGSVVGSASIQSYQQGRIDFDPDGGVVTDGDTSAGGASAQGQPMAALHWLAGGDGRQRAVTGGRDYVLRGAGGGGKGGGGGIDEADNSARSTAVARGIDIITQGPCGGPVNGLASVYLDDVPIANDDGSTNLAGKFAWRLGTQDQSYVPDFPRVENEVSVTADVRYGTPVTMPITNDVVNRCRIRLRWLSGMRDSSSGDRIGKASVRVLFEVQSNGGGYVQAVAERVREKTQANYEREWEVELTGGAPYNIRVSRLDEDSDSSLVVNAFRWESLTEVVDEKLRYPLRSYFAFQASADQFATVPKRAFHWIGHLCPVPRNYDPATRRYATSGPGTTGGVWDGTLKMAESNNPAWNLLLVATNKRWGMGNFLATRDIDIWELYRIGQYCDEGVPAPGGGTEPRWTFFAYLANRRAAWRVFDMIVAAFRGSAFWGGGKLVPTQDRPAEPVYTYTTANVVDGLFVREGTDLSSKFTRVIAYYHDDAELGARKPVVVDDDKAIQRLGIITKEVDAYSTQAGCAQRVARSYLANNQFGGIVRWATGSAGSVRAPGEVVEIMDTRRARQRHGGRIDTATADQVTLDAPVTLRAGIDYLLILVHAGRRLVRRVITAAGTVQTLDIDTPLTDPPSGRDAVWVLAGDIKPERVRLTSVQETDEGTYRMAGVTYVDKYDYIDRAAALATEIGRGRIQRPRRPTGLTAIERLYTAADGETKLVQAMFSWDYQDAVTAYRVTLNSDNEPPETVTVTGPSATWLNVDPGEYTLTVTALTGGLPSPPATKTFDLEGNNAPVASFYSPDRSVRVGDSVQFFDVSAQLPSAWLWRFGDGATDAAQNPSHIYRSPGLYTVELEASNRYGSNTETRQSYIQVSNTAPVAAFDVEVSGRDVSIIDQHAGGTVDSYAYDWGDDSATATTAAPTHTYAAADTYTITQTLTGPEGTDTTTRAVTISD